MRRRFLGRKARLHGKICLFKAAQMYETKIFMIKFIQVRWKESLCGGSYSKIAPFRLLRLMERL